MAMADTDGIFTQRRLWRWVPLLLLCICAPQHISLTQHSYFSLSLSLSLSFSLSLSLSVSFFFIVKKYPVNEFYHSNELLCAIHLVDWGPGLQTQDLKGQHFRCKPSHTQHSPMGWTNEFVDISYRSIREESLGRESLKTDTLLNNPSQPRYRLTRTAIMVFFTWQAASQVRVTLPPVV